MRRIVAVVALSVALVGCAEKVPQPVQPTAHPAGQELEAACRNPVAYVNALGYRSNGVRLQRLTELIEFCQANGWRY